MEDEQIYIVHCSLEVKRDDVFLALKDDKELLIAIENYVKKLNSENIEIFEKEKNILITENGYYCAIWENDIKEKVE